MQKEYNQELIQELIHSVDIVDYIGQYVDLQKKSKDYFGYCCFHNENTPSFSVNKDKEMFYCFGCGATGNVINFIMKHDNLSFVDTVKILIEYTNFDVSTIKEELEIIKYLRQFAHIIKNKSTIERKILPFDIMNQYEETPIFEWLSEGIDQEIMDKHQVRFDSKGNRIVFPIYDNQGNLINVKGRTCYTNFKELGLTKYIYYYSLGTTDFLYGLHNKKEIIENCQECILVESEKSIMKLEGFNINNAVALVTSHATEYQIYTLLELKTDVVVAFDKDVDIKKIKENFRILSKFTNVYIMTDTEGLLEDKDAPIDKGIEVWNKLYNNKIKL